MPRVLEHEMLKFHPDTFQCVRESIGLGAPGRMEEALALLQSWISQQDHFLKKDFSVDYLETFLVITKGSVEKAKQRIEFLCTMHTFTPELFIKIDLKNEFKELLKMSKLFCLPKLTKDHRRVFVLQLFGPYYDGFHLDVYRHFIIVSEYSKIHDYHIGAILILDPREVNLMDFACRVNLVDLRNAIKLVMKGYGARLDSMYILQASKPVHLFLSLVNQVANTKKTRFIVLNSADELRQHLPEEILPEDLGGEEKSTKQLYDEWLELYASEEHIRHMKEMQAAGTDEARRRSEDLLDPMFGLPGTFRALNVD